MNEVTLTDNRVKVTREYSKFRKLEGNREVLTARKDKIVKAIEAVGYIPAPIIVNEHMEIIDGAGRYEAAKELKLPIYYLIIPGLGLQHCITMNVSNTNWKVMDYLRSYAEMGNQSYADILWLIERHPSLPITVVTAAATELVGGCDATTIKKGNVYVDHASVDDADDALTWIDVHFSDWGKYINGNLRIFYCAILWAYRFSTVSTRRLVDTLQRYKNDFPPVTTIKYTLEQITKLYNKGMKSNKVYLNVEYDAWCVENAPGYKERWGKRG